MNRICLDSESADIKRFIHKLPIAGEGVELELNGKIVCKVIPSTMFSDAEKKSLVENRWKIIQRAQKRTKGLPPKVIEREIERAIDEVRQRKRR
jgi:hypothetical protein